MLVEPFQSEVTIVTTRRASSGLAAVVMLGAVIRLSVPGALTDMARRYLVTAPSMIAR